MDEDVEKIQISKGSPTKKIKKYVDLKPTMNESRDQSRVDQLILAGLGENVDLVKYRHVMMDPKSSVMSVQYREAAGMVLDRLLEVVFADPTLFMKVRTDLQKKHINEGMALDIAKGVIKDLGDAFLQKHGGIVGKAIAQRALKRDKKKKP